MESMHNSFVLQQSVPFIWVKPHFTTLSINILHGKGSCSTVLLFMTRQKKQCELELMYLKGTNGFHQNKFWKLYVLKCFSMVLVKAAWFLLASSSLPRIGFTGFWSGKAMDSTTMLSSSTSPLHFFKVFLPNSSSHHMSIPPAFLKYSNGTFPEKATIKDHTVLKVKEDSVVQQEDVKPLFSSKLQVESEITHKRKRGRPRKALKSVERVAPKGPFFERTMKHWCRKKIYISGRLVRKLSISMMPNTVLKDEEGKLWPVTVCSTSLNRIPVTGGWSKFYKSHKLKVNDKCEFEFVLGTGNICRQLNVKFKRFCL